MSPIDWIIVALFLGALVAIGWFFSRKSRNIEDYFVAGRSMPVWLVAIAAGAWIVVTVINALK